MSFGASPYGLGSYGGGTSFSVAECRATTTHSVLVELTAPVMAESPIGDGDALNPRTWEVLRGAVPLTVVASRLVGTTAVELRTAEAFGPWQQIHTARGLYLRAASGLLIVSPRSATFRGVLVEGDRELNPLQRFDFFNNAVGGSEVGGTLQVSAGGSYVRESGLSLLRKMVLRRLLTTPGSYFFIPPADFGSDLQIKVQFSPSYLPQMKRAIEDELRKEPDVEDVAVALTHKEGVLIIQVRLKTLVGSTSVLVEAR